MSKVILSTDKVKTVIITKEDYLSNSHINRTKHPYFVDWNKGLISVSLFVKDIEILSNNAIAEQEGIIQRK